jgi:hypothetical protein
MTRYLTWLWDHKMVLVLLVIGVLVLLARIFFRTSGPDPFDAVRSELKTAEAVGEARQARIDLGEEKALQQVRGKYAKQREQLDAEAEAKIAKYEDGPVALARAMECASRG